MKQKIIFSLFILCLGSSIALSQDDYYDDEPADNYDAYQDDPSVAPMPQTKEIPQQLPQVIPPEDNYDDYRDDYPEEKPVYPDDNSGYPEEKYPVNDDYGNMEESY
tara:strand:+ start:138 stop:455 length:318 start_codon:yes stop_codon:yes gene_type:complete